MRVLRHSRKGRQASPARVHLITSRTPHRQRSPAEKAATVEANLTDRLLKCKWMLSPSIASWSAEDKHGAARQLSNLLPGRASARILGSGRAPESLSPVCALTMPTRLFASAVGFFCCPFCFICVSLACLFASFVCRPLLWVCWSFLKLFLFMTVTSRFSGGSHPDRKETFFFLL